MKCIDEKLNPKEIEERITKFLLRELEGDDFEVFQEHMIDCEYCDKMALAGLKAERVFEQRIAYDNICTAYDKKDWHEVIRLGEEMEALGYDEEVHPVKDKLIFAIKNDHAEVFRGAGIDMLKMENSILAEKALKKAIDALPEDFNVVYHLGAACFVNQKYDEAEKYLEMADDLKPNDPIVLNLLGHTLLKREKYFQAEEILIKAQKLTPNDVQILSNLGDAYSANGKYEEAEIAYRAAYNLEPEKLTCITNLGTFLIKMNKFQESEKLLREADSIEPNNIIILHNLSHLYMRKGDLDTALSILLDLQSKETIHPKICASLAECYYYMGNQVEALKFIEIAFKLAPNDPIIENNYKVINGDSSGKLQLISMYH